MALVFTDAFDSYAATADLIKKWGTASGGFTWGATAGRNGAGGVTCAAGAAGGIFQTPSILGGVASGIFHFGFYIKFSAIPSSLYEFLEPVRSDTGAPGHLLGIQTGTGFLQLINAVATVQATGTRNVCDNNWHWIEVKYNLANAANLQTVYVDSTQDISGSFNVTNAFTFGPIRFVQANVGCAINGIDDVIVYDDTGDSPKDSDYPLGPREILTLRPNGDSAVQFTPNSGVTNWTRVNETVADGDTTYVQDGNVGDQDLYTYAAPGITPSQINGVMLNSYVENPNAGTLNFKQICKNGATQIDGTSMQAPSGYTTKQQYFGHDPNTGSVWTPSTLATATFGMKVA